MKNKYILLRHAETIKDPSRPSTEWDLTPDALEKIKEYIIDKKFDEITKIYTSTEPKAIVTAQPILEYLKNKFKDLEINTLEEFVEVQREKKFLTDAEFLEQKKKELANLDKVENGAESGDQALARFSKGIQKLEEKYSDKNKIENILIITHGTIMTIYLAKINNDFENIFQNWENLKFCDLKNL